MRARRRSMGTRSSDAPDSNSPIAKAKLNRQTSSRLDDNDVSYTYVLLKLLIAFNVHIFA